MNLDSLLPPHVRDPASQQRPWSSYQTEIFNAASKTSTPLQVRAVAGSGKTTTLVEAMRRVQGTSIFLAFNKSIAEELRTKVPSTAYVKTLNALGHQILTRKRPGAKLNQWKTHNYLRANMSAEVYAVLGSAVARVVSVAKGSALGIDEPLAEAQFQALADEYAPDVEDSPAIAVVAMRAFADTLSDHAEFDFDDQLYIPIAEGWTFPEFATAFVDEAQDLNRVQHMMLLKLADRGARTIVVGDPHQAIYGFRGALSDSMDRLKQTFSAHELPLSVTYRCAARIAALAQTIVPHLQWPESAPDGEIIELHDYLEPGFYQPTDLIVCRNNAPIFALALQFLKARLPCRVSSSFLEEFEKFVWSFKAQKSIDLQAKLDRWWEREEKFAAARPWRFEASQDKYEVLSAFCKEFSATTAIVEAIRALATSKSGPRISTIHRAKGLEAPRAIMLRYDLLPSTRAITPEQIQQEENLRYVAITRARNELIFLPRG